MQELIEFYETHQESIDKLYNKYISRLSLEDNGFSFLMFLESKGLLKPYFNQKEIDNLLYNSFSEFN